MTQLECVQHLGLGQFLGGTLHHADTVVVTSDHQIQAAVLAATVVVGEHAELTINVRHTGGGHGGLKGQTTDADSRKGGNHCQHIGVVDPVVLQDVAHQLNLTLEAVSEHGANRAIDHAHGQDFFGCRPALTLEESTGDLARSFSLLAVVHGQGEKVDVISGLARDNSGEHLCVA